MTKKRTILTQLTYDAIQKKLEDLKVNGRADIARKIQEARELGDLSENAEYDAAMDAQRDMEAQIKDFQMLLANAEIFDESSVDADTVHLGCGVVIQETDSGLILNLHIVDSTSVDSRKRKISLDCPVGKALSGHKVGDIVTVKAPFEVFHYEIKNIYIVIEEKKKEESNTEQKTDSFFH